MQKSAVLSDCGRFRYELRRVWDPSLPSVLFIGLNPSHADHEQEDNTSRVCINYAKRWGYGSLLIGNLFAYRHPSPAALYKVQDPVGPENDAALRRLQGEAAKVVCAWSAAGTYLGRNQAVLAMLADPHCLVRLKSGHPGHPLYKKATLTPVPYLG